MKKSSAKRYAKALIELGQEAKRYKEIGKELRDISTLFADNVDFKKFVLNPMYKLEDRQNLIKTVGDALKISDTLKRFLVLLTETRAIGIIEDISHAYSILEDELSGRIKVKVISATELQDSHIKDINNKLHQLTKKEIILTTEKNPALIGGLVFMIGNTVLDGSIKTQLERLREKIIGVTN